MSALIAAAIGGAGFTAHAWSQTQGPVEIIVPAGASARPTRPPEPVFENPNKDPRDFEGLWSLGAIAQGYSPITAAPAEPSGPPAPPPAPKPGEPAFDPARGSGPLTGPIIGMAAVNAESGSTLQCTPTWRLVGSGGGMSSYWIQGAKEIVLYSEEDQDVARKIYLTASHPKKIVPQPNGHSIGHWEGNVLVVDTVGFSNPDGSLTDRHVIERIEKNGNALLDNAVVTMDGKTIYVRIPWKWRPDFTVSENVCEEGFRRYELRDGKVINLNTLPKD